MRHRTRRIPVALLAWMLFSGPAAAATRHVAPGGSDAGNDCLASPCASLNHTIIIASAGDTISIAPGVYLELVPIFLSKSLTIVGSGPQHTHLTVHGTVVKPIITVLGSNTKAHIQDLELRGGHVLTLEKGGALSNHGKLSIQNVRISNNTVISEGGGIHNFGEMWVYDSIIEGNEAGHGGGGISNAGSMIIYNSYILGNVVVGTGQFGDPWDGGGGGILNSGQLHVARSAILENWSVLSGGGIRTRGTGKLSVINTTIAENHAGELGGGVHATGNALLRHVTVAYNTIGESSPFGGGGIVAQSLATVDVRNSIVAWNAPQECEKIFAVITGVGNITLDGSCVPIQLNTIGSDPLLGPLGYHGGTTPSYSLLDGSPAIDAANAMHCLPGDQRGFARPIDGDGLGGAQCDAGSFERQADEEALEKKGRQQIWRRNGPYYLIPARPSRVDRGSRQ